MIESLRRSTALASDQAEQQLHEMQLDTVHLFFTLTTVGYLAWHFTYTITGTVEDTIRAYLVFPVVVATLGATYRLLLLRKQLAAWVFVGGVFAAISCGVFLLGVPEIVLLFDLLAMVTAFVIDPLGGFLIVVGAASLLALASATLFPGAVTTAIIWQVIIIGAVAVAGVWAIMRQFFLVLNWYSDSYAVSQERLRKAQQHRAQLVRTEKKLEAACRRLERANAVLEQAWREADRLERARLKLAADISHELRTPLSVIIGHSEMMMTSPGSYGGVRLPAAYRGDLNVIYRSAQHLLSLTDDVLDLARSEAGSIRLAREEVDLAQVIRDAVALVRDRIESKGLLLELHVADNLPLLYVDRLRIRQVLLNLLINAARFTEHGRIDVAAEAADDQIRIAVTDTGSGIAAGRLPQMFRPFATDGKLPLDWHRGTGLGLAISKELIELHGGSMGVASQLGVGTTFWFTLPIVTPPEPSGPSVRSGGATTAAGPAIRPVVVVHCEPRIGRALQGCLEGVRVEVADTLTQAGTLAHDLGAVAIVADVDAQIGRPDAASTVIRCRLPQATALAKKLEIADSLAKPITRESLLTVIKRLRLPVKRILVVDDDPHFSRMVSRMLSDKALGYSVHTALNGEEALAWMRIDPPDLLLLDLNMPGTDGTAVLQTVKREALLDGRRVIAVSGCQEDVMEAGFGNELRMAKAEGWRIAELAAVLDAVVAKKGSAHAGSAARERAPQAARPG